MNTENDSKDLSVQVHQHGNHITIDLEKVFQGHQCHPEDDPGIVIHYLVKVDKEQFEVKEPTKTGRELLALVGLKPDTHRLFELGHGQREIGPDEKADFKKPGIERFKSVPKHANEGKGAAAEAAPLLAQLRKQFALLSVDAAYLNRHYPNGWEALLEGGGGWVLIHGFPLPEGYNVQEASVAFMIPASYPTTQIDMMYFLPNLSRADGKGINCLTPRPIDGKNYQQWSRHRGPSDWRPGLDNIETHVLAITGWLQDELKK
jgi:hypothetical protein